MSNLCNQNYGETYNLLLIASVGDEIGETNSLDATPMFGGGHNLAFPTLGVKQHFYAESFFRSVEKYIIKCILFQKYSFKTQFSVLDFCQYLLFCAL